MLGTPSHIRGNIGNSSLQDATHAWCFFSAFNTGASFQLPKFGATVYTFGFAQRYALSRTFIRTALRDGPYITGVKSEPKNAGLIDVNHLDSYIHDSSEWEIGFCEDGSCCCAPYVQYHLELRIFLLNLKNLDDLSSRIYCFKAY